jgi:hypothetical protein
MADLDLRHVTAAVQARASVWESAGVRWSLTVGSEPAGSAAVIVCETSHVLADLTVWAGGDAKMKVVMRPTKLSKLFYYHLATADDVATCLNELTSQLVPSG